jgi:hypothetical protein
MSSTSPDFDYWRKFSTLKIWEIAVLMRGFDPRALSDVLISSGDPNDQIGESPDFSDEERMLTSAVRAGKIKFLNEYSQQLDRNSELAVTDLVPWLQGLGTYDILTDGLTVPTSKPKHSGSAPTTNLITPLPVERTSPVENMVQGNPRELPLSRASLIAQHKHQWPSIESDLKGASENGLSAASKVGERGWDEARSLQWARSKNKLIKPGNSSSIEVGMRSMIHRGMSEDS